MPKVLVLKVRGRHVERSFLAFFGRNFGRKRSHHVMDASCRVKRFGAVPECIFLTLDLIVHNRVAFSCPLSRKLEGQNSRFADSGGRLILTTTSADASGRQHR